MNPRPPTMRRSSTRTTWHGDVLFLVLQRFIALAILISFTPHLLIFPFMDHSSPSHGSTHHDKDEHHGTGHDPHHAAKADPEHGSDHGGDHGEHAEHPDHIEPEEGAEEEYWTKEQSIFRTKKKMFHIAYLPLYRAQFVFFLKTT